MVRARCPAVASTMTEPVPAPAPVPAPLPGPVASDGKMLGIIALVVSFFFSIIGLILGFVARSQSRKAGVKNTPATVAIVLGFVFLAITVIWIVVAIVGGVALFGQCADLGPGVHILDNGATLTCG